MSGGWSAVMMTSQRGGTEGICHHRPSPGLSGGCSPHEGYLQVIHYKVVVHVIPYIYMYRHSVP